MSASSIHTRTRCIWATTTKLVIYLDERQIFTGQPRPCPGENLSRMLKRDLFAIANVKKHLDITIGRMPQSGKLPVFSLLRGRKSTFSLCRANLCTDLCETWHDRAAWLHLAKFQLSRCIASVRGPIIWKFPLLGKDSPRFLQMLGA